MPKIIRKNSFKVIRFKIEVERTNGKYRITSNCINYINPRCPVLKETGEPYSEHPMLRPFDKFIFFGDPHIGKITHILIKVPNHAPLFICSIVKTMKRIHIFPAWGLEPMKSKRDPAVSSHVGHLTIEENIKDVFRIHYSGGAKPKGKKKKIFQTKKLKYKNEHGIHIGTLGINNPWNLDPLAIVYRDIEVGRLQNRNTDEIKEMLNSSLTTPSPIFILPEEMDWKKNNHLEVSFAIIGSKLKNIIYPKDGIGKYEGENVEQLNKIPLDNYRSVLLHFTLFPNKLENTFEWKL